MGFFKDFKDDFSQAVNEPVSYTHLTGRVRRRTDTGTVRLGRGEEE